MEKETREELELAASVMIEHGMNLIRKGQETWAKAKRLTITVITRCFNDEVLIPFFLEHYGYADKIIAIVSADSTDRSKELFARSDKVEILNITHKHGYNAMEVHKYKLELIEDITSDWIIQADIDEFIFPTQIDADVRAVLGGVKGNVLYANMWQVYKHRTEMPLDISVKAIHLRRHGIPHRGNEANGRLDCKPLIFRSGLGIEFRLGFHSFEENKNVVVSATQFDGAHWKMADADLAVARRMAGNRQNISTEMVDNRWAFYDFDITEKEIRLECEQHLDDPQLF